MPTTIKGAHSAVRDTLRAMGIACGDCVHLGGCRRQGSVRQCDELEPCSAEGSMGGQQLASVLGERIKEHGRAHQQLIRILRV